MGVVAIGILRRACRGRRPWLGMLVGFVALGLSAPLDAQAIFEESPLAIESDSGTHHFEVELAITPDQRRQGLMFRESLDSDRGMLFDFGRTEPATMWMRNTFISLDMVFIDSDGRIHHIARDVQPLSDAITGSNGPVRAVLELAAGTTADLGIEVGDQVIHPMFPAP